MNVTMNTRRVRGGWQHVVLLCGAAALALTGCAADEGPAAEAENSAEQPASSNDSADSGGGNGDVGLTAGEIVEVIEPQGFECTVEDHRFDDRDELVVCKGDDYVTITATSLVDESTMPNLLASAKTTLCKNQKTLGVDTMRSAVSGKWILVPGGDGEKNLAAFDTAMQSFGLDWTEDPC